MTTFSCAAVRALRTVVWVSTVMIEVKQDYRIDTSLMSGCTNKVASCRSTQELLILGIWAGEPEHVLMARGL